MAYFVHQLILTEKYDICFEFNKDKTQTFKYNFRKDKTKSWKKHELQPDNKKTLKLKTNLPKIFATVNQYEDWDFYPGKKILVYTDLHSQLRMAYTKKSFWFHERWGNPNPKYSDIKKILLENPNNIYKDIIEKNLFDYYTVFLQDIITITGLEKVLNDLGHSITQKNIDFINYYISLHPPKLIQKVLDNNSRID